MGGFGMINYICCNQVDMDVIYRGFIVGFSDYMIKFDMTKEIFVKHFFGLEGNDLNHSFIALEEEKPVGLILGGVKNYDGLKTMRCGALCIHPDYRGKGISFKLFSLHKQDAIAQHCKQMCLEVIVGNDRAIQFYKKMGYEKVYDLSYYFIEEIEWVKELDKEYKIKEIGLAEILNLSDQISNIHINWQNDFDYIKKSSGVRCFGVYKGEDLVSGLCMRNNKISFLWTTVEERNQGLTMNLLKQVFSLLNYEKLTINFPNNHSLYGFVKHNNFTKDSLSQYEMYLTL